MLFFLFGLTIFDGCDRRPFYHNFYNEIDSLVVKNSQNTCAWSDYQLNFYMYTTLPMYEEDVTGNNLSFSSGQVCYARPSRARYKVAPELKKCDFETLPDHISLNNHLKNKEGKSIAEYIAYINQEDGGERGRYVPNNTIDGLYLYYYPTSFHFKEEPSFDTTKPFQIAVTIEMEDGSIFRDTTNFITLVRQ